jgi:hypothetical protein
MGKSFGQWSDNKFGNNVFGENSNMKGLDAQKEGAQYANNTLGKMYNQQRKDFSLQSFKDLNSNKFMDNWQTDPGYQFRLQEGEKAINSGAAARGMGQSGATLKALTQYGQNLASQEYGQAYDRNYSRLSQLAGFGNQATANMANASANYGNAVSGNQIGIGNAGAAAHMGMAGQAAKQSEKQTQMFGSIMGMKSDERLKTDVQLISKEDMQEMKSHIKPYSFKYIDEKYGKGNWVGVMAQDLEKSKLGKTLVFEDENGHKTLDPMKIMSLFLATMAEG